MTKKNEEELNIIKVQYAETQERYIGELKDLEAKVKTAIKQVKKITSRRDTESSTFTSDIQALRKRVTDYERYIKKLKYFVDKENTDALINEL